LLGDTPGEDITSGLVDIGFDVTNVKQMTATCQAAEEGTHLYTISSLYLYLQHQNRKKPSN
jgi:hypothetical protein